MSPEFRRQLQTVSKFVENILIHYEAPADRLLDGLFGTFTGGSRCEESGYCVKALKGSASIHQARRDVLESRAVALRADNEGVPSVANLSSKLCELPSVRS